MVAQRLAASGLEARVAWEFEYIVLEEDGRAALPANRCWSADNRSWEPANPWPR